MSKKLLIVALLLVSHLAFGAENFNGTTGQAASATAEVTAAPLTMSCMGRMANVTADHWAMSLGDTAGNANFFDLFFNGSFAGDPVTANTDATTSARARSTTGFNLSTWTVATGVYAAANSRAAYEGGGGKGTNTTSLTPAGIDATGIGVLKRATPAGFANGDIAECGLWNDAKPDDVVAMLGMRFAPSCRIQGLVAYYKMLNDATSLKDTIGTRNDLTLAGTTAVATHPNVINCQ